MSNPENLIPQQRRGISKEVHQYIDAASEAEAAAIFERARSRLLHVNEWAATAEGVSSKFLLCDRKGTALSRPAQQGDLVRIDLPGMHRAGDSGYDWVVLDTVEAGEDAAGYPWIVLTTRPVADPFAEKDDTAHFFSDSSTGTFIIRCNRLRVEGHHYGRNELPNDEGSLVDKVRALAVTIGAYLGLSDAQWSNLVKGLLH